MSEKIGAYSEKTKTHYDSWEDLVKAESNGWVATAILRERAKKQTLFTLTVGPFETQHEASNARARLRSKYQRESREGTVGSDLLTINVRPAWKEV